MTKRCPQCGKRYPDEAAFCALDGAPLVAARAGADADPLPGRELLGRYRVLTLLGRGGFGDVYAVENFGLGRREALKVLHLRELAGLALTPAERRRYERWLHSDFLHERRSLVWLERVRSPYIAGIYDGGVLPAELLETGEDRPFFTMELIEGFSLRRLVEREGMPDVGRAVRLLRHVCEALRVAHELVVPGDADGEARRGIVHRDLKLENVMVGTATGEEIAKVLDFGVAKVVGDDPTERSTMIKILTPGCAAPEQMDGDANPAVDLFALGVLGYELLTGHEPWRGRSLRDGRRLTQEEARTRIQKAGHLEPVPLEAFRDDLPAGLRDAIYRLLEKHPENRFPSARSADEALAEVEAGLADGSRRPPPPPETEIVPPTERVGTHGPAGELARRAAIAAGAGGAIGLAVSVAIAAAAPLPVEWLFVFYLLAAVAGAVAIAAGILRRWYPARAVLFAVAAPIALLPAVLGILYVMLPGSALPMHIAVGLAIVALCQLALTHAAASRTPSKLAAWTRRRPRLARFGFHAGHVLATTLGWVAIAWLMLRPVSDRVWFGEALHAEEVLVLAGAALGWLAARERSPEGVSFLVSLRRATLGAALGIAAALYFQQLVWPHMEPWEALVRGFIAAVALALVTALFVGSAVAGMARAGRRLDGVLAYGSAALAACVVAIASAAALSEWDTIWLLAAALLPILVHREAPGAYPAPGEDGGGRSRGRARAFAGSRGSVAP